MSNDVVLASALRTNLLSLQSTQSNIDSVQRALSTGLKVNSALDNPQSFFAAQSLNNRSNDLGRLLDSIGQSISAIQTADKGISSLTKLVEQADSIASQARDAITSGGTSAKITGNATINEANNLVDLNGITANDTIRISLTDPTDPETNAIDDVAVTIGATTSAEELVTAINDLNPASGDDVIKASLDDSGQLQIEGLNSGNLRVEFRSSGGNADDDATNLSLASALGFGEQVEVVDDGTGNNNVEFTQSSSATLTSFSLYEAADDLAEASDSLNGLTDRAGNNTLIGGLDNAADQLSISVNGATAATINLNGTTIQGLVDGINGASEVNGLIEASFNEETGQLSIRSISADAESVEISVAGNDANTRFNLGFGGYEIGAGNTEFITAGGNDITESIRFGAAAGELATLEQDFNTVREQIDSLVRDSSYRGTNLLNGDQLTTFFNEDRTSSLTVEGANFTSSGLGIEKADFGRSSTVNETISQIRDATLNVRSYGSTLANNLAVIQTREDFTKDLINELEAGADKLTVADPNEEGAKLLALQTRQQLGVTALSLASQSQQSVLRLF